MIEQFVRNEEPLPDGWWFIPPGISLEQFLDTGIPCHTTGTEKQKGKKKAKRMNAATHATDCLASEVDLPQVTANIAESELNILLTTAAPNLRTGGTVIASLMERFPQESANFNAKLREFYDANVSNGDFNAVKQNTRSTIHDLLLKQLPECELYIVGSTVNGCGTMDSDLDMCLVVKDADGGHPLDKQYVLDILSIVQRTLIGDRKKRFINVELIPHATVPVISFDVHLAGLVIHVDINVNQLFGIRNSSLLLLYSKIDKRFSILRVLVRQWAKMKGIGNAKCGGLNSYTLNLMVLHYFIFASDPPVLPNLQKMCLHLWDESAKLCAVNKTSLPSGFKWKPKNKKSLAELVLGFFDYFAHFDFDTYGISTAEGIPMERNSLPSAMQKYNIIVMDPFEPVNAARPGFNENHPFVLDAFRSFVHDVFGESALHLPSELLNEAGEVDAAPEANDDEQEEGHRVESDTCIAESQIVEESRQHNDVRINGRETMVHQENVAAKSSAAASSGQQLSSDAVSEAVKEAPLAAERSKKARCSRLSKLRKHCWCL